MSTYSATENSSSKHPGDWGRAMAVALTRLVDQARADGHIIEHENLYGASLHLTITEAEHGVQITLRWNPEDPRSIGHNTEGKGAAPATIRQRF